MAERTIAVRTGTQRGLPTTRLLARTMLMGVIVGAPILIFLFLSLVYTNNALDDPYITYRYSRNLARGYGLVWNIGERPVEGYSTFLWAVINAPFIRAGLSPLLVSKLISLAAGASIMLLAVTKSNAVVRSSIWRSALAFMVALCPVLVFYGQSGMETLFFTALIFGATLIWLDGRIEGRRRSYLVIASMVYGAAALTRPEGAFIFGIVLLYESCEAVAARCKVKPGSASANLAGLLLPFLTIWLPYFLWRVHFYGHLLPNTCYAKYSGHRLSNLPLGIDYLGSAFSHYLAVPTSIVVGLCAHGFGHSGRGDSLNPGRVWRTSVLPALILVGVYTTCVLLMGGDDTAAFPSSRLLAPVLPILWIGLMAACEAVTEGARASRRALLAVLVLALCMLSWVPDGRGLLKATDVDIGLRRSGHSILQTLMMKMRDLPRESPGDLSIWISRHTSPGSLIAVPFAGKIPYYTDRPALDMLGLNDLHIAHLRAEQRGIDVKMDPDYVLRRRPELIFVNVDASYWKGHSSFEDAGGWKLGDRKLLALLHHSRDYTFVESAPTTICVFRRRSADASGRRR